MKFEFYSPPGVKIWKSKKFVYIVREGEVFSIQAPAIHRRKASAMCAFALYAKFFNFLIFYTMQTMSEDEALKQGFNDLTGVITGATQEGEHTLQEGMAAVVVSSQTDDGKTLKYLSLDGLTKMDKLQSLGVVKRESVLVNTKQYTRYICIKTCVVSAKLDQEATDKASEGKSYIKKVYDYKIVEK